MDMDTDMDTDVDMDMDMDTEPDIYLDQEHLNIACVI